MNPKISCLLLALACGALPGQAQPTAPTRPATVAGSADIPPLPDLYRALESPQTENFARARVLHHLIQSRQTIPEPLIDKLLRDPSPDVRQLMSGYPFLSDAQFRSIIGSRDPQAWAGLLRRRSSGVPLPSFVIPELIRMRVEAMHHVLADPTVVKLRPEEASLLAAEGGPLTRFLLAQNYGLGSADEATAALLQSGPPQDIQRMIGLLPAVPEQVVDQLLAQAPLELRRVLATQGKFTPTPAQMRLMLQDLDPQIRLGAARRTSVPLPVEVVNAGALDDDEKVAFAFRERLEFRPDAALVDQGLRNKNELTRFNFARRTDVVLSAAQIERGLTDSAASVRRAVASRSDVALTDAQTDRCLIDADYSVRSACVQRPDFQMNQSRFEVVVRDSNPNLVRSVTQRQPPIDFGPLVAATLQSGSAATRVALASQSSLPLDAAQMQLGLSAAEAEVRAAFANRQRQQAGRR